MEMCDQVLVRDKEGRGHPWLKMYFLGFKNFKIIVTSSIDLNDAYQDLKGVSYKHYKEIKQIPRKEQQFV